MAAACPTDVAAQAPAPAPEPATPRRAWPRSPPLPPAAPDGVAAGGPMARCVAGGDRDDFAR